MSTKKTDDGIDRNSKLRGRGIRLRQLRRDILDMTVQEFAQLCESGVSTVGQWEQGRVSGLAKKSAECVVRALEKTPITCTVEWLLEGKGPAPHSRITEPEILVEQKELPAQRSENIQHQIMPLPVSNAIGKSVMLEVQDDAMAPFFKMGDCVGGKKVPMSNIDHIIGEVCIAQISEEQTVLRKLDGLTPSGKYRLSAINPNTRIEPFILETELMEIATLAWFWRPGD